jgi:diguanylate cyclase (GGDEF)-like protein
MTSKIREKKDLKELFNQTIISTDSNVYIVFMDGNGMKRINDVYGHLKGDLVIKTMQDTIVADLGEKDYMFRFGGDEFVVLMQADMDEEAISRIETIQNKLKAHETFKTNKLGLITISCGMVKCPPEHPNIDKIMHVADMLMYQAKKSAPKFFAYSSTINIDIKPQVYSRGIDTDRIALRLYFDFIHRYVLNIDPECDANILLEIQREVWEDWSKELLTNFAPKDAVKEFLTRYEEKTGKKVA